MSTLREISESIREALEAAIDPETGEISAEGMAEVDQRVESFTEKAVSCIYFAQNLELEAAAHKGRKAYLQALLDEERAHEKALVNKAKGLREYVKVQMLAQGIREIETDAFRWFRVRDNPVAPVRVLDIDQLPQGYYRKEAITAAIRDALKAGEDIPGAEWGERGTWLETK